MNENNVMTHLPPLSELDTSNPPEGSVKSCFICEVQQTTGDVTTTTVTAKAADIIDNKGRGWCEACAKKALSMLTFKKDHKQDRNERCACGSGKKYKHCCMDK